MLPNNLKNRRPTANVRSGYLLEAVEYEISREKISVKKGDFSNRKHVYLFPDRR